MGIPTLTTDRLVLRPFAMSDCDAVTALASAREVAATTLVIPHPYSRSDAEQWIESHEKSFETGAWMDHAIVLRDGTLIGAIGTRFSTEHNRADFGYWIGLPYWGRGYATEAGREVVRYCFEHLAIERITAHHFATNPASGRVIQKIGLKLEGVFPRHVRKWGEYQDCVMYGLLRDDWKR